MWGLSLGAVDSQTGSPVSEGYLTYDEIIKAINADIENDDITEKPASSDHILYVDASNLYQLVMTEVQNNGQNNRIDVTSLKDILSPNNLVFLPVKTTSTVDNTASKTTSNSFLAGGNIVLVDKKPFFTPYTINVQQANYATYTREVTIPANGQVVNATVILPFTMSVTNFFRCHRVWFRYYCHAN